MGSGQYSKKPRGKGKPRELNITIQGEKKYKNIINKKGIQRFEEKKQAKQLAFWNKLQGENPLIEDLKEKYQKYDNEIQN